ncbi:MAG TPA: DUF2961 domain-containing protein [Tepidisphaeraceae bacterium]|jgi:hypothetical protein
MWKLRRRQLGRALPLTEALESRQLFAGSAGGEPWGLDLAAQFDRLPYLTPDRFTGGQSSYQRSGGNTDWNNYIRVQGNGERVILDEVGPGVLDRMWFTRVPDAARIKMYFDGETTPRVDLPIVDLVRGKDPRFVAPLVGGPDGSSGGYVSYVPQAYRQSLRVTVTGAADLYYNVGYQTLMPGSDVTTWTGAESSTATRDIWNQVSRDPKPAAGNVTATGTVNVSAGASSELVNLTGPRSIASIKLNVPGVAVTPLMGETVTDNGRSHKGYSEFTLALPGGTSPVTLVRRLDFGVGNQKANVLVDGISAGQWFDAGSDQVYHWRDSSFALPLARTAGKTSIRVRVQFVSSDNDWNEFRYTAVANGAAVDTVDVGTAASETSHGYVINTPLFNGTRTFTYPPPAGDAPFTDEGRSHRGTSRFNLTTDPQNRGVLLDRLLDHSIADQKAAVYVNGAYVGDWTNAGSNSVDAWQKSTFYIPETFTSGKSSIAVQVNNLSASTDWSEFSYEARSITGDGEVVTDRFDVGDTASESAHAYQITQPTYFGTRSNTFPHASANAKDILNQTWLRISYDGESAPSVYAPLGSFFGMGEFGVATVRSLPVGIDENQNLYVYFPMPFRKSARVELVNQGTAALNGVRYEVQHNSFTGRFEDVGYFKTFYNPQRPTQLGKDVLILDTAGSGKFVGVTQSMRDRTDAGPLDRWYLEGDERIYVDGSRTPVVQGTGTEDFYDGAFYFDRGPYTNPLSGNTTHITETVGSLTYDSTSVYRFLLHNAVPFQNHIRVSIEHGGTNDTTPDETTLAYYYVVPTDGPRRFGAVLTDSLDVSGAASEAAHHYAIAGQTFSGSRSFTFEGDFDDVAVTDIGRAFNGSSEFDVAIDPNNQGVILRRLLDQGIADQRADIYVDGVRVGTWYKAGANTSHRWAEDDFAIPASLTAGKSSLHVRVQFVSSAVDWNEFAYSVYTLVPVDVTAPEVLQTSFSLKPARELSVTFSEEVIGVDADDLVFTNLGTGSTVKPANVAYDPATHAATWTLPMGIADGRYRAAIAAGKITDRVEAPLSVDYRHELLLSSGTSSADNFQLRRDGGGNVVLVKNGLMSVQPLANLDQVAIDAAGAQDTLEVYGSRNADAAIFEANAIALNGLPPINISGVETIIFDGVGGGDAISIKTGAKVNLPRAQQFESLVIAAGASSKVLPGNEKVLQANTLSVHSQGVLDLTDHDLVVTSGNFGTIWNLVLQGYRDSVDSTATGIVSTTAQTALGHPILAVFDNAKLHAADWPWGSGTTVGASAILGRYALLGDADLNDMVTPDDYGAIDSNLGSHVGTVEETGGMSWFSGDWNFDGKITPDDYLTVDANLGLSIADAEPAAPIAADGAAVPLIAPMAFPISKSVLLTLDERPSEILT